MVDRVTGRVVHIDFGDCFEVAMQRDKFPEKVPFRLTRMIVNAMEVRERRGRGRGRGTVCSPEGGGGSFYSIFPFSFSRPIQRTTD